MRESCLDKSSSSNCAGLGHIPYTKASPRDTAVSDGGCKERRMQLQCNVKAPSSLPSRRGQTALASKKDREEQTARERRALPRGASAGVKRSQRVESRGEKRGYIHTPRRVDEGEE